MIFEGERVNDFSIHIRLLDHFINTIMSFSFYDTIVSKKNVSTLKNILI